jgi:hypothetical protein
MVHLSSLITAALLPGVFARALIGPQLPDGEAESNLKARQGYYFQNWSEGGSNIRCNNGGGGSFSANWNSKGGFVCGKGWKGSGARCIPTPLLSNLQSSIFLTLPLLEPSNTPEPTTPPVRATSPSTAGRAIP